MASQWSPFLRGAVEWLFPDGPDETCSVCDWNWTVDAGTALIEIGAAPDRFRDLLDDRNGMAVADDGGWNATSYVWHLVDLARSWTERWFQLQVDPGARLVGWDPDELADARHRRALPTEPALRALGGAVESFVTATAETGVDVPFVHGDWGRGTVADGTRWLGHEMVHHLLDVDARAR